MQKEGWDVRRKASGEYVGIQVARAWPYWKARADVGSNSLGRYEALQVAYVEAVNCLSTLLHCMHLYDTYGKCEPEWQRNKALQEAKAAIVRLDKHG